MDRHAKGGRAPLSAVAACVCAVFMLGVVPLLFRHAYFDINRVKVDAVCRVVPILLLVSIAARPARGRRVEARGRLLGRWPFAMMLALVLSCVLSCAFAGFEEAVLTGSEGRRFGLYTMLSCGAAFLMIAFGRMNRAMTEAAALIAVFAAAAVALLGVANALGVDPLYFYRAIDAQQRLLFVSTIGNVDFFGIYLALLLPLASGQCVFGDRACRRLCGGVCAGIIALGVAASRTDSAFFGMQIACIAMVVLAGDSFARLSRALALWAVCFLALPVMHALFARSVCPFPYLPRYEGVLRALCVRPVACWAALALLFGSVCCAALGRRAVRAPGRKRMMLVAVAALAIAAALLLAAMAYWTVWAADEDIGAAASVLRFDDRWGSRRGGVYIRSMRAFFDFDWREKLFGRGMGLTRRVLTPYLDNPDLLLNGVFNDSHCQLLNMLLTCGLFGMLSFAGLYLCVLAALWRHAGRDPLACGALASLAGYGVAMLLSVTQPILIVAYLSVAALGVARINALTDPERGKMNDEP